MKRRSDDGFTIVELLISLSIVAVIGGVLFQVLYTGLRTTDATRARLAESSDAQFIASYLVPDLQSVDPGDASQDQNAEGCGTLADEGISVLQLSWSDDAGGGSFIASYRFDVAEDKLTRYLCDSDGTIVRANVLADELAGPPTIPLGVAGPRITMVLVERSTFTYEVTGIRRSDGSRGGIADSGSDGSTDGSTDGGTDGEPPVCEGTLTVSPGSVTRKANGHLNEEVVVTATVSATCEPLHLHFNTGEGEQTPSIPVVDEADPTVRRLTITTNAYKWTTDSHVISLHRETHDTDIASSALVVTGP